MDFGLFATRPNIPSADLDVEEITIPGRDGALTINHNTVKDISIAVKFGFYCAQTNWGERFRRARKWLLSRKDNKLILGDDAKYFYKVKKVLIEDGEREIKTIGQFTVNFICEGCQYVIDGQKKYSIQEILYNPYYLCKPIFKVKGEGVCKITMNEKIFSVNVGQNVTIDTGRMITYREDGVLMNTKTTGDYESLYLKEGDNTIEATQGFDIKVIPNWRCL